MRRMRKWGGKGYALKAYRRGKGICVKEWKGIKGFEEVSCILVEQFKMQDGCHGLWLAEAILTSLELLHVKSPDLSEMYH
jgi:hypothetical protein